MFRVAVAGAGGMAGMHARCYGRLPNAQVVGVMDIREEAASALAAEHRATAFTDFDRMLDEVRPDVVDVCVPTPWHVDYVCRAAGRDLQGIVVEKPMGRTIDDCDRMIAACRGAGIPLFPAHVLRFFPEFSAASAQVRAGAVGQVATVRTRRGGPFPRAWENWYGRVEWSGGLVLDLIIHDFDWLRWTFGEVARVYADGVAARQTDRTEVDLDYALVTLRFASGVIGHVEGTWADPGGFKVAFEVAGDQGLLEYNFNQPTSPPFIASLEQGEGARAGVAVPESPMATNPYQEELAEFLASLEEGRPAAIQPEDGREAARIALAALESIRTGRPVDVKGEAQ